MSKTVNIMTVTLALTGLPLECPHCGERPPDGQWALSQAGHLLHVTCPRCFTAVAPVRAVAAPQPVTDDSSGDDEAAEAVARAWNFGE